MSAWNPKSKLDTFITQQLKLLRDADAAERAKAHDVFRWIDANNAFELSVSALTRCAPVKVMKGVEELPNIALSPLPAGHGYHMAIVLGFSEKGPVRCIASNEIVQPVKESKTSSPKNFFQLFDTAKSTAEKIRLTQEVVNAASVDQLELIGKVCAESLKFCTSALFIVVLTADRPLIFTTTLMATGPQQMNLKLSFTGKVTP